MLCAMMVPRDFAGQMENGGGPQHCLFCGYRCGVLSLTRHTHISSLILALKFIFVGCVTDDSGNLSAQGHFLTLYYIARARVHSVATPALPVSPSSAARQQRVGAWPRCD